VATVEQELPPLAAICAAYGLESATDQAAVKRAYDAFRAHHAPCITSIAVEVLADLRRDVAADPNTRIVFLGRDGYSLAVATRTLDPEFFAAHCHDAVLSRAVVESAVQDLEKNAGKKFPQVQGYRENGGSVGSADVDGSYQRLTRYLRGSGVPVGIDGSRVTLVDSCLKGTVQELMAASYPQTQFTGRYMFYDGIASDPHPGSKKGYVLHRDDGIGGGLKDLPDDPALTFASLQAIRTIENALQGPLSSPSKMTEQGPEQRRLMDVPDQTWGCNPILIDEPYRNPAVREATKVAALRAVLDSAAEVRDGAPLDSEAVRQHFTGQVRAWLTHSPQLDPELKVVLDSFVHRDDHRMVRQLDGMLRESGQTPEMCQQVWQSFDVATTMQEKNGVVERVQSLGRQPRPAASADGPDATAQPTRLAARPEVKRGGGPAL
jgi:hypothetical protein